MAHSSLELTRQDLMADFVASSGWSGAQWFPLTADASFRSYTRLEKNGRTAMLMDAPPEYEDVDAYLNITEYLRSMGFSVPMVHASDRMNGFALIEDFGSGTFTTLLKNKADETGLYMMATDVLVALHTHPRSGSFDLPPYDKGPLLEEVSLFVDWYVPAKTGQHVTKTVRDDYLGVWAEVLSGVADKRQTLVHRDFHVDNIMRLEMRDGVERCGLLDYQDALNGAYAYDVMSLVEDARRDVNPALKAMVLSRYKRGVGDHIDASFDDEMEILGASRHAKVAGIFVRLAVRDGKPVYLEHIPRVVSMMNKCLGHPALEPVRNITNALVPDFTDLSLPFLASETLWKR